MVKSTLANLSKMKKKSSLPRGLRNNNPLNIRGSKTLWLGQTGTDGTFCKFESMRWGYRAAFRLLHTYRTKYNIISIRQIIGRWAPPNENNTQAYIDKVCTMMGVEPHFRVFAGSTLDEDVYWCCNLVKAMAAVENCLPLSEVDIKPIMDGYTLAFEAV